MIFKSFNKWYYFKAPKSGAFFILRPNGEAETISTYQRVQYCFQPDKQVPFSDAPSWVQRLVKAIVAEEVLLG